MIDYKTIKENTKEGVTIIYIPERKLWGVQFKDKKATFFSTFEKIVEELSILTDKKE